MVADGAAEPKTCAVVMWSRRFSRNLPGLRDALQAQGYVQHVYGINKELWLKRGLRVSSRIAERCR